MGKTPYFHTPLRKKCPKLVLCSFRFNSPIMAASHRGNIFPVSDQRSDLAIQDLRKFFVKKLAIQDL